MHKTNAKIVFFFLHVNRLHDKKKQTFLPSDGKNEVCRVYVLEVSKMIT